mgnify:CR=1 FL=1
MIIWALFDSGNGCYKQVADTMEDIEIYSVGLDVKNKNAHFINLNLASYDYVSKKNPIYKELDKLPTPDLIIASIPCESWSVASSMWGGMLVGNKKKLKIAFLSQEYHYQSLL